VGRMICRIGLHKWGTLQLIAPPFVVNKYRACRRCSKGVPESYYRNPSHWYQWYVSCYPKRRRFS